MSYAQEVQSLLDHFQPESVEAEYTLDYLDNLLCEKLKKPSQIPTIDMESIDENPCNEE